MTDYSLYKRRFMTVLFMVLAILLFLSLLTFHPEDIELLAGGLPSDVGCQNYIGVVGACLSRLAFLLFGLGAYVIACQLFLIAGGLIVKPEQSKYSLSAYILAHVFISLGFVILLGLFPQFCADYTYFLNITGNPGGEIGKFLSSPQHGIMFFLLNQIGCILVALMIIGVCGYFIWGCDWAHLEHHENEGEQATSSVPLKQPKLDLTAEAQPQEDNPKTTWLTRLTGLFSFGTKKEKEHAVNEVAIARRTPKKNEEEQYSNVNVNSTYGANEPVVLKPKPQPKIMTKPPQVTKPVEVSAQGNELPPLPKNQPQQFDASNFKSSDYQLPNEKLLSKNSSKDFGADATEIEEKKRKLKAVMDNFKISVTMGEVYSGPRLTLYEIIPADGVKVEKISSLKNNMALSLMATNLRVLAPIPGKGAVGVEVPNSKPVNVLFHDLITSDEWKTTDKRIPLAIGRGVDGQIVLLDLAKAPHLLVAGATGMGKSVGLNALLMSMLYTFTPDELKFILIDPKTVEFTPYRLLPNLICPVVTDIVAHVPKVLRWAIDEMNRRYRFLAKVGVRQLSDFNKRKYDPTILDENNEPLPRTMPYIAIVIDEVADIMQSEISREFETGVQNLVQKARAIGIHIIAATQRPSTDVITGTIKANFPTRIAYRTSSYTDSMTIIDQKGAEELLGNGDSFLKTTESMSLIRAQGAYISDEEVSTIISFISAQRSQNFELDLESDDAFYSDGGMKGGDSGYDEDVKKCIEVLKYEKEISISKLQRLMRYGYNKSANIIEILQDRGVVSEPRGSRGLREVLIDKND